MASGIEAITAPADASQPIVVNVAHTVVPIPTQSSSSGTLSHLGSGLKPPQSIFQQRSSATCIIGTIHHPVVGQSSSILGQAASAAGIGPGIGVGSGPSTTLGGESQIRPTIEAYDILPSSLVDQEDDEVQILPDQPSSQRVYMIVGDDVGKSVPPSLVTHIKSEKTEANEPTQSSRVTLPPHLQRGGSSRAREVEEDGEPEEEDDDEDDEEEEDGKEGEEKPPSTEVQRDLKRHLNQRLSLRRKRMTVCSIPQGIAS